MTVAKKKQLSKKLYYGIGIGVLGVGGITTGVLVPVLSKNGDRTKPSILNRAMQISNAKSKDETIKLTQALYGLDFKTVGDINKLNEKGIDAKELKQQYQSAVALATMLFSNKDLQVHFKSGQDDTSKLEQLLLTITPQGASRNLDTSQKWPTNNIDKTSDKVALLITFFKGKVIGVTNQLQRVLNNEAMISFWTKTALLFKLLTRFKLASPVASNFSYYNAYLDPDGTKGLGLFKNYLLTLGEDLQLSDLTGAHFTKTDDPNKNKTRATLSFRHEGITISKDVNDFVYNLNEYNLSWKLAATSKIADEIVIADVDASRLPANVTIARVTPSLTKSDGSTVTLTFSGGKVASQELGGLITYQSKAQAIIKQAANDSGFVGANDPISNKKILPSAYHDKQELINMFKDYEPFVQMPNDVKAKVRAVFDTALIALLPDDNMGTLQFKIRLANMSATFTISGFDTYKTNIPYIINQKIDAEVAKRTMPRINLYYKWKTGRSALPVDFLIRASDKTLNSRVLSVVEKTGLNKELWGTIVVATIEVSSSIKGTKTSTYQVEIPGFVSLFYANCFIDLLKLTPTSYINKKIISRGKSYLGTGIFSHNKFREIRGYIKQQVDVLKNNRQTQFIKNLQPSEIQNFKNLIDNNMSVSMGRLQNTNHETKAYKFTIKLGFANEGSKSFTINIL